MKMEEASHNGYKSLWKKEKIALYKQFLNFPHCFQKICTADTQNITIIMICKINFVKPFLKQALVLSVCSTSPLKTLWEKEELRAISLFPTVFLSC